jgi:transposase-like protein
MDLTEPRFNDPDAAREYLERVRWPEGPVCPHCGETERRYQLKGKAHRPGLWKCASCRKQYSVTVGTVFERSKIPLHKWLLATALLCASKKGMSSHQLHRTLGVTYKTAWFMSHRIREAMNDPHPPKLGGGGGVFEIDETFIGGKKRRPHGTPTSRRRDPEKKAAKRWGGYGEDKAKVFALVERSTGRVRSFHVADVTAATLRPILWQNIDRAATIHTDEAKQYNRRSVGRYRKHESVNHSMGEYVRGDVTTNRIEGYFSILKRGIYGVYQHVSRHHLHRYLDEFDFRYSNRDLDDAERADAALRGAEGKRLLYRQPA